MLRNEADLSTRAMCEEYRILPASWPGPTDARSSAGSRAGGGAIAPVDGGRPASCTARADSRVSQEA